MSQENVELLREMIDRWNRGEPDMSAFHPNVEWLPRRAATEGVYRGIAGVERFLADTEQVFDIFELRYQLLDLGERVLAWGGGVYDLRDGKVSRIRTFLDHGEASRAAGLYE